MNKLPTAKRAQSNACDPAPAARRSATALHRRPLHAGLFRQCAPAIDERIAVCRDPTDDKFLELAVNGKADLIVTGDADLLVLNPFRDIPIVAPATFVAGIQLARTGLTGSYTLDE